MILDRLAGELEELAQIEQRPNLEGRNMTMVLGPSKAVLKGDFDDKPGGEAPADGEVVADVDADAPAVDAPESEDGRGRDGAAAAERSRRDALGRRGAGRRRGPGAAAPAENRGERPVAGPTRPRVPRRTPRRASA